MYACHLLKSILAEVAAMRALTMNEEHWTVYLMRPCQQWLVEERLRTYHVPSISRVATTLVVATWILIIGMIVFHKERSIFWQWIYYSACTLISA